MVMRSFALLAFLAHVLPLYATITLSSHITSTTTITQTLVSGTSTITIAASTPSPARIDFVKPTASSMPGGGPYSDSNFRSSILNSTNYFRTRFIASPLEWDSTLAAFAQQHAQKCIFEHSGGPYGENLAEGFATPALGVDAWAAEEKHYKYPDGGFSESTGHFTQLVWQNTTHVGCAAVDCGSGQGGDGAFGWYMVCEYSPAGNVIGEFRYNVRKPGESADGKLGFGEISAASGSAGWSRMLLALVAVSFFAALRS